MPTRSILWWGLLFYWPLLGCLVHGVFGVGPRTLLRNPVSLGTKSRRDSEVGAEFHWTRVSM